MPRKAKSKPLLGLDVGSSAVKLVEVRRGKQSLEATATDLRSLSPDVVVDGAIVDNLALASSVAQMLKDCRVRNRSVATAVSGNSVIVKQVTMPAMTEEELAETIEAEAAQHIPFERSDVHMDYQILDIKDSGAMDILLVAVKKDKVGNYTNALSMAGLSAVVMDHDPLALENCYEYNYEPAPDEIAALLNVGASVTNIVVTRGAVPLFTRDVSVGGNQYTDALQKEFHLSADAAEAVKLGRANGEGADESRRLPVLQSVTKLIVLEVQKTFDFFRASTNGQRIARMYLSGGAAQTTGLKDTLQEEFGETVDFLDPFRRIAYPDNGALAEAIRRERSRLAVAVGLALRSFDDL